VWFIHADFVSVASELPAATLVTLDRVVCCYTSYESLLNAALSHAQRVLAPSYPRDVWYVREGVRLENAERRLTKNSFRTFVHPAGQMEKVIRSAGFGVSRVPGLIHVGRSGQSCRASALLCGVGDDAARIVAQAVEFIRHRSDAPEPALATAGGLRAGRRDGR
jgi:hypothetical protein